MNETEQGTRMSSAEDPIDGWRRRFHRAGERVLQTDPGTFPMLVEFVELLVSTDRRGEFEICALMERAMDTRLPPPPAHVIATGLVWADLTLSDVRDLDTRIEAFSDDERREVACWVRRKQEATDFELKDPTMPGCVAGLYQTLETTPCAD